MSTATKTRECGTRAKYVSGCHCDACKQANREAENLRSRAKAYGTWEPYVDAEPARRHVRRLRAQGMGYRRVGEAAGLSNSIMWKLLYGVPSIGRQPSKRIRPETEAALLAVKVDLADHAVIDSTGTVRRVQALVALGYSQASIAARIGVARGNFQHLVHGTRDVTVATARQIAAVYDELSMTPAVGTDRASRNSISRARGIAARAGWVPPLAWDDETIDDPDARPVKTESEVRVVDEVAVMRAVHGDSTVQLTIADRREAVRILHGQKLSDPAIAARIGIADRTVLRIRQALELPANFDTTGQPVSA